MTINALQAANRAAGYHFFDADTLRFFNSIIGDCVWLSADLQTAFFVTSERFNEETARQYKVRTFHLADCSTGADVGGDE